MTNARSRWLRITTSLAFVALLVPFAMHVDWRAAAAAARGADPRLLVLAFACNQLSLMLKGARWWVFLRPLGVRSPSLVLRATYAGASLNNLVVAQGGEAARVLLVSRASRVPATAVAGALALERVLDGVSYLTLLTGAAFAFDLPQSLARWRIPAAIALAGSAVVLFALGTRPQSGVEQHSPSTTVRGRVHATLRRFAKSVSQTATAARLTAAMFLSLAAWALQVATYHAVALAAHLPISLAGSVAAMLAIGISFLIRATPGNVGIFQVIYAVTVASFGIDRPAAVAAALLIQAVQIVPTVVLGTLAAHGLIGAPARELDGQAGAITPIPIE